MDTLSRVFLVYPESRESGRAYERFMGHLESELGKLLSGGRFLPLIDLYLRSGPAVAWAPTRDVGSIGLLAARAYEALGAPGEARRVYEQVRSAGSRALSPEQAELAILRTRTLEREPEALREWTSRRPEDRQAHLRLAQVLVAEDQGAEARGFFGRAERLSRVASDRLDARAQADRIAAADATAEVQLQALLERQRLWRGLPAGEERSAWEGDGALAEARLRFAVGDYADAARLYDGFPGLSAADIYAQAVAELRSGRRGAGLQRLDALAVGDDPQYQSLSALHGEVLRLQQAIREDL